MSDWPDDWYRKPAGAGSPGAAPGPGSSADGPARGGPDATTSDWPQQPPRSSAGPGRGGSSPAGGARPPGGTAPAGENWRPDGRAQTSRTYQAGRGYPPGAGPVGATGAAAGRGTPGGRPPGSPRGPRWRRWLTPRRISAVVAVLVVLVLVFVVGMYFFVDSKISRQDVLVDYSGRPAAASGTNWLIAGSDSRQGLTTRQERRFSTGFDVSGQRSDTVMVLHIPASGAPLLISLPRDSYVPIPGHGYNKLNAAYAFGGPKLLAQTVQNVTGLRIEHFMDIGFGGFVHVVNDVGGVRLCLKTSLHDVASGIHLRKGCQNLDGDQALAYVRDRHSFADQDLQRVQDQRLFLKALLDKLLSPGVVANPLHSIPAASDLAATVTVDQGTSLYQLLEAGMAMRHPDTTTVPIANANYETAAGDAVEWDSAQAKQLFGDLNRGTPVPKSLISGSHQS